MVSKIGAHTHTHTHTHTLSLSLSLSLSLTHTQRERERERIFHLAPACPYTTCTFSLSSSLRLHLLSHNPHKTGRDLRGTLTSVYTLHSPIHTSHAFFFPPRSTPCTYSQPKIYNPHKTGRDLRVRADLGLHFWTHFPGRKLPHHPPLG